MRFTTVRLIIWFCWILEWQRSDNTTISAGVLTAGLEATQIGYLKSEGEEAMGKRAAEAQFSGDMRLAHGGIWLRVSGRIQTCFCPDLGCCRFSGAGTLYLSLKLRVLSVMAEKQPFVWEENTTFY
jgi:hypothetical protein